MNIEKDGKLTPELYYMLKGMPKPKFNTFDEFLDSEGKTGCPCDKKKLISLTEVKAANSTIVQGVDSTCDECKSLVKGMCPVLCAGCREVVAHVEPGKDPDGFERVAGVTYHVKDCPKCNEDKFVGKEVQTVFAEKVAYVEVVLGKDISEYL